MRTTVKDVRLAFAHYARVLSNMGVDTSKLKLQEGSGSQVYRVFLGGMAAPGTANAAFAAGYLGDTAKEAAHTLRTMTRSLEFAHTHFANPE